MAASQQDERVSILTAYVVGLEGVLARLTETEAKAVFISASDFAAGVIRMAGDAAASGALPAAQRTQSASIHKNFHDGWPSLIIPAAMDLVIWRSALVEWLMNREDEIKTHFRGARWTAQLEHHLAALYEGLGVIERHRGDVRTIRPAQDQRARTAQQKFSFDFKMR